MRPHPGAADREPAVGGCLGIAADRREQGEAEAKAVGQGAGEQRNGRTADGQSDEPRVLRRITPPARPALARAVAVLSASLSTQIVLQRGLRLGGEASFDEIPERV